MLFRSVARPRLQKVTACRSDYMRGLSNCGGYYQRHSVSQRTFAGIGAPAESLGNEGDLGVSALINTL
jgi:hypothetical protein